MRIITVLVFYTVLLFNCIGSNNYPISTSSGIQHRLDSLYAEKSFFELRAYYNKEKNKLKAPEFLRYGALIDNLFGKYEKSNATIDELLRYSPKTISDSLEAQVLKIKLSNSIKLFDYESAYLSSKNLIENYTKYLTDQDIWGIKNNQNIWATVRGLGRQRVTFDSDILIEQKVDQLGVKNVNIGNNFAQVPFVFDTGANLSVVIESVAASMKLDVFDTKVKVFSITGKMVDAKIGFANSLRLNEIQLENILFLIFPDEALFFPQFNYQIKGVLGFPVLSALNEIHFLDNGSKLLIPKQSSLKYMEPNLSIEYLTPYVNLNVDGSPIYFSFDTGANRTSLYEKYYQRNHMHIKEEELLDIKYAGAGGEKERKGYKVDVSLCYREKCHDLKEVSLYPVQLEEADEKSFGNLGQDFISKFNKMVINFNKMFVHFE